jgi:flagellar M-ring protein FliF
MATAEQTLPLSLDAFNRLNPRQKFGVMAAVALAIALLVGGWLWAKEPAYGVVFANLAEKDGGQIVAALQQQNIPYRIAEGGSAILVPAAQVHDVRLRLASQGLPKGGLVGFEVMETQKLGISQFAEQINYQRALEGELARSIQSLAAVRGARVHLAIPKQTAFLREEQKPTASVLLALHAGRTLEPAQVAGIVHLVSSSVPQLNPSQVSVVDQDGNLISSPPGDGRNAGLDPAQLKYLRDVEQDYRRRVEAILAPVVGAQNVRAQVTVDVDFSQSEQVAETYKPNPTPDTAIRSQQTAETASGSPGAVGVPGALSNQPPVPATAPITSPAVAGGAAGSASNTPANFSKNATVNYEVDKTVRHTKGVPGTVRRLTAAVVVNHKMDAAKGKAAPLTDAEMRQVNALVQQAVGFDKDRGDTVNVANVAFAPTEQQAVADAPIWKDPSLIALAKDLGKWLLFALLALLLWKKLFKPLFEMFAAAAHRVEVEEETAAEVAAAAGEAAHGGPRPRGYEEKIQQARELAKQDPKLVAGLIKEWVGGESR